MIAEHEVKNDKQVNQWACSGLVKSLVETSWKWRISFHLLAAVHWRYTKTAAKKNFKVQKQTSLLNGY